ncbi:MAG TPA: lysophospholipid transporter LplT [Casimicrobiaceae bacterium]|jgi:LPLT family lysophospholipid transporter-like MFS transporter|nr:lysophospholipid transporter LplT [Casimicrobiaceae bacterium]
MQAGFYIIMAAQFFSSLADNALLVAAIQMLRDLESPAWMTPSLKQCFVISYVVLAPVVGAFADSMPKGRVMLITNGIKILGCGVMLFTLHPLVAYALVGLGAAAYSPAKYGILTELLPARKLVVANGWIEGTTVASIILGVLLGGVLISGPVSSWLLAIDIPKIDTGIDTPPQAAVAVIMGCYAIAALINWYIPNTGVQRRVVSKNPLFLIREFAHCNSLLWRDKLGQISLATTTLFWGAGATLQFIVIDWAATHLCYNLSRASYLQGVVAIGIALGAALAARLISLSSAVKVLPLGVLMGVSVIVMIAVNKLESAIVLMTLIGAFAGFFVVPMNALLQHRGHVLMGAGHSIAVQNFNENIGVLIMLSLYAVIVHFGLSTNAAIVLFGLCVSGTMLLVMWRHRLNLAAGDLLHLVAVERAEAKAGR